MNLKHFCDGAKRLADVHFKGPYHLMIPNDTEIDDLLKEVPDGIDAIFSDEHLPSGFGYLVIAIEHEESLSEFYPKNVHEIWRRKIIKHAV